MFPIVFPELPLRNHNLNISGHFWLGHQWSGHTPFGASIRQSWTRFVLPTVLVVSEGAPIVLPFVNVVSFCPG